MRSVPPLCGGLGTFWKGHWKRVLKFPDLGPYIIALLFYLSYSLFQYFRQTVEHFSHVLGFYEDIVRRLFFLEPYLHC